MADSLSPGEIVERYEVVRRVGIGGMAEVYRVHHTALHTVHALKVLTLSGPGLHERMAAEGRVQASLRHPNVIHVSDVLFVRGMPALVMEFVDGPDLKAWIAERRPAIGAAEDVFRGIVAGVAAAHAAGVIHRDLKPANVLLATVGGVLVPKVGDFGIVKVVTDADRGHTRAGMPMGTPQYMAPEQMRDAAGVDRRADVFSLGCVLYELLTGEQAYPGTDLIDIFERIDQGRRAPLPDTVPVRLRVVVDRCLARDPSDRPPDCATLLAWLDGAPVAPPVSSVQTVADATALPQPARPVFTSPQLTSQQLRWIGVLALLCGVGAILLVTLAIVGLTARRMAPVAVPIPVAVPVQEITACPTAGGRLGWVRAPAIFEKKVGSAWTIREETPVVPRAGAEPGSAVCRLPAGARLTLVEAPITSGASRWVAVHGEELVLGAPDVREEEDSSEVVGELCHGPEGVRIGWFHTRPSGLRAPARGGTWRMSSARQVLADYPRPGNGNRPGPPVCAIPAQFEVGIVEEVVRVGFGKGYWVPLTGTDPPP